MSYPPPPSSFRKPLLLLRTLKSNLTLFTQSLQSTLIEKSRKEQLELERKKNKRKRKGNLASEDEDWNGTMRKRRKLTENKRFEIQSLRSEEVSIGDFTLQSSPFVPIARTYATKRSRAWRSGNSLTSQQKALDPTQVELVSSIYSSLGISSSNPENSFLLGDNALLLNKELTKRLIAVFHSFRSIFSSVCSVEGAEVWQKVPPITVICTGIIGKMLVNKRTNFRELESSEDESADESGVEEEWFVIEEVEKGLEMMPPGLHKQVICHFIFHTVNLFVSFTDIS
jgi:hypothetical protein